MSFFILFPKQILLTLFGKEYAVGYVPLIILSIGYFLGYLASTSGDVLLILKRTKLTLFNNVVMLVVNIVLNWYLIPIYGIIGAAIATSSSFILRSVLLIIASYKITNINPFKFKDIKVFFSILVAFLIIKYVSKLFQINILTNT